MNRISFYLLTALLLLGQFAFSQVPETSVFKSHRGANGEWLAHLDNHRALYQLICNEAFAQIEKRKNKIEGLKTETDWLNYQQEAKEKLCKSLEKFKKTPLNPQITGTLERSSFTVEKILFESHPGFFVTGCLFLPKKRQNPAPAVIYVSGHTDVGFRSETYQHVIINLVQKGFVVFAFDPVGQGERLQYVNSETGKSKVGGATAEHSYAGVQTLLTGTSLSDYFIWDGIRALDYLETRQEVDMKRIGITGRSGGGTQSAMIAACDERIYAAAPECYITSFKRLLQSIGPQDAEQNPYHALKKGFDHPDFLHARAPKPSLIITTTHDFFSIQGARETFREVQKSYAALGNPDNIQLVESYGSHESTRENREKMYAFFRQHLNLPGDIEDVPADLFPEEDLWVTETGQVSTSLNAETVHTLNKKYFAEKKVNVANLSETLKNKAGIDFNRKLTTPVYTGKFIDNNAEIKKYFLENNKEDYVLPVYEIQKSNTQPDKKMIWLHPNGKKQLLKEPLLNELLENGYAIYSCDLPGTGELFDPGFSGDGFVKGVPFNYTFGANLAGKSIAGLQAESVDLLVRFVQSISSGNFNKTDAIAQGNSCAAFLHFTALKNPFRKIVLLNPPDNNRKLIEEEFYNPGNAFYAVPGSLPDYDYPDLISLISTEKIISIKNKDYTEATRFLNH